MLNNMNINIFKNVDEFLDLYQVYDEFLDMFLNQLNF